VTHRVISPPSIDALRKVYSINLSETRRLPGECSCRLTTGNGAVSPPIVLHHESGGRTKHRMILVFGAVQTTAWPVGLSIFGSTRSHGTVTHELAACWAGSGRHRTPSPAMQVVRRECLRETQDNLDPFGRSTRMYLTNIRSSVDANGKPHRTHRISRAGVSGDSTTTILYSAVQLGQRNANGAGFFIVTN